MSKKHAVASCSLIPFPALKLWKNNKWQRRNHPPDMKQWIMIFLGVALATSGISSRTAHAAQELQNEVVYLAQAQASYSDPEAVDLDLVIWNRSKTALVVVVPGLDRIQ